MKHYKNNKIPGITPCLSILTLNVNGLNSLTKSLRMGGMIKSIPNHLFPTRNASHWKKQTLTWGKRVEKGLPSKWTPKVGRSSYTYI
jgi:hypothetical protein